MTEPSRRVLLCSMAVPWPNKPLLGMFHHQQARAVEFLGSEMRIFSPAPWFPRVAGWFSPRIRRHLERPLRYDMNGVHTWTPRTPFAFPPSVRFGLAERRPRWVTEWAERALIGPLRRVVGEWRPDALLAHGMLPWGRVVRRLARELDVPFGFIEHSADDILRIRRGTPLGAHYVDCALGANALFTVGIHQQRHLEQELGLDGVRLLSNGAVAPTRIQLERPIPAEMRGRRMILAAANYYERKGLEVLVDAFCRIAGQHEDVDLHLITNAPRSLRERIVLSGFASRIWVHELMDQHQLIQWMVWADLFALPSWREAFGMVFAESLAARTPVVMTSDCGLAEMLPLAVAGLAPELDDRSVGWLVAPRDVDSLARALDDAMDSPARLTDYGQNGVQTALREFSWRRNAEDLLTTLFGPPSVRPARHPAGPAPRQPEPEPVHA